MIAVQVLIVGMTVLSTWLCGRKYWWAWYWAIASELLWTVYSIQSKQYGFLVAVPIYLFIQIANAIKWTKERPA